MVTTPSDCHSTVGLLLFVVCSISSSPRTPDPLFGLHRFWFSIGSRLWQLKAYMIHTARPFTVRAHFACLVFAFLQ